MNEQTTKLVEQLANRLGTTTEYLWSVLLKQAPISATIDLIFLCSLVVAGVVLFKIHKKIRKPDSAYAEKANMRIMIVVAAAFVWGILIATVLASMPNIIIGFFHPEYWALKEILKVVQ